MVFLLLCFCCRSTLAAEPTLRILTTEEPPANYMADNEVSGITTDIINDLRTRTGEKATIEVQPWPRVYQTALLFPNTLIFTLGKTPDRVAQGLVFIGPVTTRKHAIYKRADSNIQVSSIENIRQSRLLVGGMRGDWRTKLIRDSGVRIDEAATHEKSLRLLMNGRVDLIILSDMELKVNLEQAGVAADQIALAFFFTEAPAYIAFSKGTSEATIAKWRKAFSEFQASGVPAALTKKWGDALNEPMAYSSDRGFYLDNSTIFSK